MRDCIYVSVSLLTQQVGNQLTDSVAAPTVVSGSVIANKCTC